MKEGIQEKKLMFIINFQSSAVGHLTLDYDEFEDDPQSPLLTNRPV